MENLKSLEDLLLLLLTKTKLSRFVEPEDITTLKRRIQGEGISFLTTVLPRLDKYLLERFQNGTKRFDVAEARQSFLWEAYTSDESPQTNISVNSILEFKELMSGVKGFGCARNCAYPRLFQKAWAAILEKDGSLRAHSEIDVDAVMLIRQVSHLFYKLELPFTTEQISSTIEAFKQAEMDVIQNEQLSLDSLPRLKQARRIVHRLLAGVNPFEIDPKHGSGSSACGVVPHKRYESFRFISRLDASYPYDRYFFFNSTHLVDELHNLLSAEVADPPAKVVLVPKDSRGPRLISEEPREFMYIQQGLMKLMYGRVEALPAVASQIGFTDQTRNQNLAREGSLNGTFATLDLKEASDRVSWKLVEYLFPSTWVKALGASRSIATTLPDGEILPLHKFAPMGSACCFPVEAICFWAIALSACGCDSAYLNRLMHNRLRNTDLTMSVFGDDIIVPTQFSESVSMALESVGLLVNKSKSFTTGPFRESCGGDFFLGRNVTPVRCKTIPMHNDERSVFRTVEMLNNILRKYGYDTIGLACEEYCLCTFRKPIPVSNRYRFDDPLLSKDSKGLYLLGHLTDVPTYYRKRWNKRLQKREYRVPCMEALPFEVELVGWSHVLRKACVRLHEQEASRLALPKRYRIKYRWVEL